MCVCVCELYTLNTVHQPLQYLLQCRTYYAYCCEPHYTKLNYPLSFYISSVTLLLHHYDTKEEGRESEREREREREGERERGEQERGGSKRERERKDQQKVCTLSCTYMATLTNASISNN